MAVSIIPVFDANNFLVWKYRFEALCRAEGCHMALTNDYEPVEGTDTFRDALSDTNPLEKKNKKWLQQNDRVLLYLTLSFDTPEMMNKIDRTVNGSWPHGQACEVIKKLTEEYQPILSKVEAKVRLAAVSMNKKENPTTLFDQVDAIKQLSAGQSGGYKINDDEYMAQIMACAPTEYATTLASIQCLKGADLTIEDLKEAMKSYWRGTYNLPRKGMKKRGGREREKSHLVITRGKCYTSSKDIHTAINLHGKKILCKHCGRFGHQERNCWELEANKGIRPDWYKPSSERYNKKSESEHQTEKGGTDVEIELL